MSAGGFVVPIHRQVEGVAIITQETQNTPLIGGFMPVSVSPVGWTSGAAKSGSQDASGRTSRARSRSWGLTPAPGAYSRLVAWRSGADWFDALMDCLATIEGDAARRRRRVSVRRVLAVARAYWTYADQDTGRGVTVSHGRVGRQLGICTKTVQRATRILEELGFAVTLIEGRYLDTTQRQEAFAQHGRAQLRAASTRALIMPKPVNVHLPHRGLVLNNSLLPGMVKNQRASARRTDAPRPPALNEQKAAKPVSHRRSWQPWSTQMYRFGQDLAARLPWLTHRRSVASVCAMLDRAGIDPAQWSVTSLIQRINTGIIRVKIARTLDGAQQRDPIAYTAWLIGQTIDPTAPTPAEEAEIAAARRAQRMTEADAERQAEAARVAAIDHDEVDRIIAQMKADIAQKNRLTRQRRGHQL